MDNNDEVAASVQQEPPNAARIAERIFFRILADGGEGNPFTSMKSEWFIEQATPVIEASLGLRPAAPRTQGRELDKQFEEMAHDQEYQRESLELVGEGASSNGRLSDRPVATSICNNCGKPVENTSGVLLHIRDGMEFVNETLPDKKRCFMFAALALPEAQPTPGWISVKERLPEAWAGVKAYAEASEYFWKAHYDGNEWCHYRGGEPIGEEITHWQPLPSPPEHTPTKKEGQ